MLTSCLFFSDPSREWFCCASHSCRCRQRTHNIYFYHLFVLWSQHILTCNTYHKKATTWPVTMSATVQLLPPPPDWWSSGVATPGMTGTLQARQSIFPKPLKRIDKWWATSPRNNTLGTIRSQGTLCAGASGPACSFRAGGQHHCGVCVLRHRQHETTTTTTGKAEGRDSSALGNSIEVWIQTATVNTERTLPWLLIRPMEECLNWLGMVKGDVTLRCICSLPFL